LSSVTILRENGKILIAYVTNSVAAVSAEFLFLLRLTIFDLPVT